MEDTKLPMISNNKPNVNSIVRESPNPFTKLLIEYLINRIVFNATNRTA